MPLTRYASTCEHLSERERGGRERERGEDDVPCRAPFGARLPSLVGPARAARRGARLVFISPEERRRRARTLARYVYGPVRSVRSTEEAAV